MDSYTDISETAHILIRASNPQSPNQDSFWDSGAETILTVLIGTLLGMGEEEKMNLGEVLVLLQRFGADGKGLDEVISRHAPENIFRQFQGFLS